MPDNTPQNTVSIDDLAGQIKARRPDLAAHDNTELVRKLIGAKPEFQQYLSQEELPKIVGSMGAAPPSPWDRFKAIFTAGNPNYSDRTVYDPKYGQMQLVTPEAAMTPLEQKAHPITTAINEVSGSLTSPENTAILAGTMGLGGIPGTLGKVARAGTSAYFAGQMGRGAYQENQAANQASAQGDTSEATRLRTHAALGLAGAGLAGYHATTSLVPPRIESPAAQVLPTAPERITPQAPTTAIETPQQAASTPNPVHQAPITPDEFRGADGPMRPFDPQGTRFARGGTVGMEPINPSYNAQPSQLEPGTAPNAPTVNSEALQSVVNAKASPEQFVQALRNETEALRDRRAAPPGRASELPPLSETEKFQLDKRIIENQEMIAQREGRPQGQQAIEAARTSDPVNAPSPSKPAPEPVTAFDTDSFHNTMDSVARAERSLASPNLTARQRGNWQAAINNLRGSVRDNLNDFFQRLAPESHEDSLANIQAEAERLREQAKVGRSVLDSDPVAKAMRGEMANSRPIRPWKINVDEGVEGTVIGNDFPGQLRDQFHQILGDRVTTEGGIPEEAWTDVKRTAKAGLNDAKATLQKRMEDIATAQNDPNIPKADLVDQALRQEKLSSGRDLLSEVRDLQSILGTQRERLRYQGKGLPVTDEQGVVRPAGSVGEKTLEFANKFFDKKNLNKIPDDSAWEARAKDLERRASLLDTVAKKMGERRKAQLGDQGGFVGEGKAILDKPQIEDEASLLDKASMLGRETWKVSADKPSGKSGWLSADGKSFIDKGYLNHEDIAQELLPGVKNPYRAMLENGWIRKGTDNSFEVSDLTSKATSAIESDMIRSGNYGQHAYVDFKTGETIRALSVDAGWSDFSRAVQSEKVRLTRSTERGAISGIELMGSSAAGMTAGAAVGYHVAGAPGALVGGAAGYAAGFVLPALYRIPAVADVLSSLGREIKDLGYSTAGGAKDVATGLVNFLAPKVGVDTKSLNAIMQMKGDIAQSVHAASNVLESYRKNIGQLPQAAQIDFIDRYKTGQPQGSLELQALDSMIRQLDKENYDKISLFKPGLNFLDNHFRMLYKTIPGATEEGFQNWMGKRPLAGSRGFLQQHVYDTLSDAMAKGGVPITTNPIDMFLMSHADVQRFVHANMLWEQFKNDGTATFVRRGDRPTPGYVPLDDRISKVYFPASSGEGLVNPGQYYVQEGAGRLMNNYLSPDYIRQNVLGKKIVDAKNIWNGWELLGGFHAVTINAAGLVQNMDLAAQRMWNLGLRKTFSSGINGHELMGGIRDLIKAPVELAKGNAPAYIEGRQLSEFGAALDKAKRGDQSALGQFTASDAGQKFLQRYPGAEGLLGDAFTGGLNMKMSDDLRSNISKSMLQDFADKKYLTAGVKLAPAALYEMNRPLFDYYIPRLKLGMFMRDMSVQLKDRAPELLNGTMTREELARKTVDRIENVFGEMNFDNLFWNKTFKTSMQLFYRSITWRLGTSRLMADAITGQSKEIINAVKQGELPRLDPNFGFVGGSMLTLFATSAVMMKLMSGKNPQSITDLTHPQTGEKNDQGRPVRLNIPGYGTEFMKLGSNPAQYMMNGRAGWVDKTFEAWQNKDFYGKQIANPNDPKFQQFAVRALHTTAPTMIMNSNIEKMQQTGAGPGAVALGTLGFSPASKSLDMSPAELKAQEIMVNRLPQGGKTDADLDRSQAMKRVQAAFYNKQPIGDAFLKEFKAGRLQDTDLDKIIDRLQTPQLEGMLKAGRANLNDVLDVYQVANDKEKPMLKGMIGDKVDDLFKMTPEVRKATLQRIHQMLETPTVQERRP